MRPHPRPMLAVIALCMAAPALHAAGGAPTPSSASAATPGAPAASDSSSARTGTRRHWRHWTHHWHGSRASGSDFAGGAVRSGRGHSMRWHTVRDSHGGRRKVWYYADTGGSASGPNNSAEPARDLDAPMSRSEAADLHERRVKALDHLAAVEARVEHDRRQRAIQAKARFHRILSEEAAKARAAKK